MPRNVLFLESGRGDGGSAFSLFRLVKSLDRSRYLPHVVVSYDARAFEQIGSIGVPVTRMQLLRPLPTRVLEERNVRDRLMNYCSVYGNLGIDALCNGLRMAGYIRRHGIDLVHLNNGLAENLSGAFAARLARVPCVAHLRGTDLLTKVDTRLASGVSAVVTLNHTMFDRCTPVFGREKVHLILNGVDLDAFREPDPDRIRREFGIPAGTFLVGTFARLVEGKGIPEFIAMASRVSRECGDSRFFVVGHDPQKDAVPGIEARKLADDQGLGRQLVLTGWRNDRIDIMAAMDVVVQISTTFPEGMSLAPLEAMALAKPIIVTDIPGYEFCVNDGKTGFVVPPGDIDALMEKVMVLARDSELRRRMGQEGHRRAIEQFDIRLTASRIQEVYDQVLSDR